MADPIPFLPRRQAVSRAEVPPLVTLDRVGLRRGGRMVLRDLDLALGTPGCTAIMGPNGAGKSLLLRALAGLERPAAGTLRFAWPPTPDKRRVALVFQRPVLLRRSAQANLTHALRQAGVARRDRAARAADLLDRAELANAAHVPARALSGGEQQRLAFVRALAQAPDLLLLDEPTASLDPRATAAIEALVRRSLAEGVRVILVTHDAGQARRLADRIVFLHDGAVAEDGQAAAVLATPRSAAARAYLGGELLL